MHPTVFLPQMKIIIYFIYLCIYAARYFVGHTQENSAVVSVIFKQHIKGKPFQCQKEEKYKIASNEEKNVTHGGKLQASSFKPCDL
jgi:hypothetical protein